MISVYLPYFLPGKRYTLLHLPYSGSHGHRFPTLPIPLLARNHRYYDLLRLPKAHLGFIRFSLSSSDTLPALLLLCLPVIGNSLERLGPLISSAWSLCCTDTPNRYSTRRQLALPSSRVTPINACPALRPRWYPDHSPCRNQDYSLPTHQNRRLSPAERDYPFGPPLYIFRGSITQPASLIHLASDFRYRFCPQVSLLPCWLGFGQVGLELSLSPTG